MKASVHWLNSLIEPPGLSAEEVEHALTFAAFAIDAREPLSGGDTRLDVEVTSNRGDCLCHAGLAREIAACTGRSLKLPEAPATRRHGAVAEACQLRNTVPELCPRFTVHVIRGAKIGPSPQWLVERLEAVGQRAINNAVDATNLLNFLYGQPAHVFDLAKLAGGELVVRHAKAGEELTTLDGKRRKLAREDLVVADRDRAQSLAGVIGGADSEVTTATRDIVLEAATWDPVTVRNTARRHAVRTDASHRFERYVDGRTVADSAAYAAALIAQLTGGTLSDGMLDQGRPPAPLRVVSLRTERCRALAGVAIADAEIARLLGALGVSCDAERAGVLRCTIPAWRPDLEREVDLIEEAARTRGLHHVPVHERFNVAVRPPQATERAAREVASVLTGLGFHEAVTFSFTTPQRAGPWLPAGMAALELSDERRAHEPTLRPSVLPSLLACRRANQDAQVRADVRLFETGAVFGAAAAGGGVVEHRNLALLMDVPVSGKSASFDDRQRGVRLIRGVVDAVVRACTGAETDLRIEAAPPHAPGMETGAYARVSLGGEPLGYYGLISAVLVREYGLERPVAGGELNYDLLVRGYPPRGAVRGLPQFPAIERDVSLIVADSVAWNRVRDVVGSVRVDRLEGVEFVGSYRGKQTGPGRKSVTLRLRFRDPARTLRHEEVDPQVEAVVALARRELAADIRTQ